MYTITIIVYNNN